MSAWNRLWAVAALAALAAAPAAGQGDPDCQTELTPELAASAWELHVSGAYEVGPRPEGVVYVPLTFHVVRTSAGTWPHIRGMQPERLQETLDVANGHFAPTGIQFCRVGPIRYIDDDLYHYWTGPVTREGLFSIGQVPGTINVYFTYGRPNVCGSSSFSFSPLPHGILMGTDCMPPLIYTTFSHELGHYFDLFHTFEKMFGVECASGSNCDVAGDLICDTPADPGGGPTPTCTWPWPPTPGPCLGDPPYNRPMRNLMSGRGSCRDEFTPEQSERMLATIMNQRTELDLTLCSAPCYADCDQSGALDFFDFLCFQNAFLAGDPYADCDGSGVLDFFDFLCFQNEFLAGCP